MITDNIAFDIILGGEFLAKNRAVINLGQCELFVSPCSVKSEGEYTLLPGTEMAVVGILHDNAIAEGEVSGTALDSQLGKDSDCKVPLKLRNTSGRKQVV